MSTTAERKSETPQRNERGSGRGGQLLPLLVVAVALVAAGVGALIVSGSYDTPHKAVALGENLAINEGAANPRDLNANNSPALVRNPVEQDNLVEANRIDSPAYSCSLNVSFDGGGRWAQTPIPAPSGEEPKCYAPDAVFSADGTLFVSYVTLKGRANAPNNVWITRSTDGGKTLSEPVRAPLGARSFQVRLTADPTAAKRIFLTWLKADELGLYQFSSTGNPIMAIRSDDGGVNWTAPARVSSASRQRVVGPSPAAGTKSGELNVLYLDLGDDVLDYAGGHRGRGGPPYDGDWQLVLARSTDNGATWRESVVDDALTPTERFIVFTPPFPSLAIDPDNANVYAAFQDGRNGDADVMLWTLEGGKGDWSGPVRVNDTPRGDGTSQYLPKLAVAPDGRLDVLYYDRRADKARDLMNQATLQSSFDHGETFTPAVRLSSQTFDSSIGFGRKEGLPDLGSRLAMVSGDRSAMALWTDTRAGTPATQKQDLAQAVVAVSDPEQLSDTAEAVLRYGGFALIAAGLVALLLALRPRGRRGIPEP